MSNHILFCQNRMCSFTHLFNHSWLNSYSWRWVRWLLVASVVFLVRCQEVCKHFQIVLVDARVWIILFVLQFPCRLFCSISKPQQQPETCVFFIDRFWNRMANPSECRFFKWDAKVSQWLVIRNFRRERWMELNRSLWYTIWSDAVDCLPATFFIWFDVTVRLN